MSRSPAYTLPAPQPDSREAVLRLLVTLAIMVIGASGMYVVGPAKSISVVQACASV